MAPSLGALEDLILDDSTNDHIYVVLYTSYILLIYIKYIYIYIYIYI